MADTLNPIFDILEAKRDNLHEFGFCSQCDAQRALLDELISDFQQKLGSWNIGTINGEFYILPNGFIPVSEQQISSLRACHALLGDLDRSENGRHEGDAEMQSATGTSQGNPFLKTGTRVGTTISGAPIVVPPWSQLQNPEAWVKDK